MKQERNGSLYERRSSPQRRSIPDVEARRLEGGLGMLFEIIAMFAVLGGTLTLTLLPIL